MRLWHGCACSRRPAVPIGLSLIGALVVVLTAPTLVACGSREILALDGRAPDSASLNTRCAGGVHARVDGADVPISGVQSSARPDMMSATLAFSFRLFKAGASGELAALINDVGGNLVQRPDGTYRLVFTSGTNVRALDLSCSLLDAACTPTRTLSRATGYTFAGWVAVSRTGELSLCAGARAEPGVAGGPRSLELYVPLP